VVVSSVLARARAILQDDIEPYRFSDAYLMARYSDAQQQLGLLRPDLLATTTFGATALIDVTVASTAAAFDESLRMPLAYLTCEQVYLTEDSDAGNVRQASQMRQKYEQAMTGF